MAKGKVMCVVGQIIFFVVMCFMLAAVKGQTEPLTPAAQISALNQFYDAMGGASWIHSTNWNVGDPCLNQWFGVQCQAVSETTTNVTGLYEVIISSQNQSKKLTQTSKKKKKLKRALIQQPFRTNSIHYF
jgi:hypothetical protein